MATTQHPLKRDDSGVALILVLLAILVLTMLAAAMVFSARTETLAGYNYRIATQTEYVARAGVQAALNFFKGANYQPLPPSTFSGTSSSTYYSVTAYQNLPVLLYYSVGSSVVCCGASATTPVVLGKTSASSNYPTSSATGGTDVVANWVTYVNSSPYNTVTDGLGGSGNFTVTATLMDYHTVNNAYFGVAVASCSDPLSATGICRTPNETWLVKSVGTWNSNIGSSALPTVEVDATIAPMFLSYFGNALYGLCNLTIQGNVCTDAYNSNTGTYSNTAGTGGTNDMGKCATISGGAGGGSTGNAQPLGAGIGSNGGVTINGGSNTIGGNVTYANQGTSSTCNTGFTGSSNGVAGSVLPGPAIPPPPDLRTIMGAGGWGYPTSANSVSPPSASSVNAVANVYFNTGTLFAATGKPPVPTGTVTDPSGNPVASSPCPGGFTAYIETYQQSWVNPKSGPSYNAYSNYTCTGVSGAGTGTNPYKLGDVTATGSQVGTINFVAPDSTTGNATVVAMNSINIGNKGVLNTSNTGPAYPVTDTFSATPTPSPALTNTSAPAFVLDVYTTVNLGGQANLNYNPATPGVPSPMFLTVNIEGTDPTGGNALNMTGQAQLDGTINIPNGSAKLGGSGSTGAMFGSILAQNITDGGNYPVHYDIAARNISGQLFVTQVVSMTRPKY